MIYKIDELRHVVIGREIDGGITALRVDCSAWLERYPQLTQYRIEVTSPAGVVYIAETEFVDGILTWNITQADTSQPGDGQYQIVATGADGERKTSSHPRLTILDIMKGTAGDAPPAPSASWVDQVLDNAESAKTAAQNAEDAADRAEDAAVNPPVIGENATWLVWDQESGVYVDSGLQARAETVSWVEFADGEVLRLASNTVYTSGAVTALTLEIDETAAEGFRCSVDFSCGAAAASFVYPDSVYWSGDSLDWNSKFVPVHSHRYHIDIWYDGVCMRANASGVIIHEGNA